MLANELFQLLPTGYEGPIATGGIDPLASPCGAGGYPRDSCTPGSEPQASCVPGTNPLASCQGGCNPLRIQS